MKLQVKAYGQRLLNFSSGVLFSSLTDSSFAIKTRPGKVGKEGGKGGDTTIRRIVEEEESSFQPTLGALLHFYRKQRGGIHPALSLGVGLRDSKAQYLAGVSLIFGDDRRFVITLGIAGSEVTRLGSGLRVGQRPPEGLTDLPERSVLRTGPFIGLTYNLP